MKSHHPYNLILQLFVYKKALILYILKLQFSYFCFKSYQLSILELGNE